jgi:hypothetical protein
MATSLASAPATHAKHQSPQHDAVAKHVISAVAPVTSDIPSYHVHSTDLHPMTDEEKVLFPGRENWDKTEWYESQFKSAKAVVAPEHVDEWHNGGMDQG